MGSDHAPEEHAETIRLARNVFTQDALGAGIDSRTGVRNDFDASTWYVGHLRDRITAAGNLRLYFTPLDSPRSTVGNAIRRLDPPIDAMIKSWIVLNRHGVGNMQQKLLAGRLLDAALARYGPSRGRDAGYPWNVLSVDDLTLAERLASERWGPGTAYRIAVQLLAFVDFLNARGVTPQLSYRLSLPRVEDSNRYRVCADANAEQRAHLPSQRARDGLADAFANRSMAPPDRVRICIVAILLATGLRISEVLTLPLECMIEQKYEGRRCVALRYWTAKARGGEKLFATYPLSDTQAELIRCAVTELREHTECVRERARVLEHDPDRVPLGMPQHGRLSTRDLAHLFGVANEMDVYALFRAVRRHGQRGNYWYAVQDLEAHLLTRRGPLWTVDARNGYRQPLSQSLCIAFRNFFHPGRGTNPCLVDPVKYSSIGDFIVGGHGTRSIFERLDIRESTAVAAGVPAPICRVTTHQFRHWMNTLQAEGGMPLDSITRLMNRTNARDTRQYTHVTPYARAAQVRGLVRSGGVAGPISVAYRGLPVPERERFLETHVQAAHVTVYGYCLHNFAIAPCAQHLNCLRDCKDHHVRVGDTNAESELVQLQSRTVRVRAAAISAAQRDDAELAPAYVAHSDELLRGIKTALAAVRGERGGTGGELIPVFPNGASRFESLAASAGRESPRPITPK